MSATAQKRRAADLKKLTDEDLLAAVTATVEQDEPDPTKFNQAELQDAVFRELNRRIKEDPEGLPGTGLLQIAVAFSKAPPPAPEVASGPAVSILDRIDALPPEHAAEILRREIARLDATKATYFAKIEQLVEAK